MAVGDQDHGRIAMPVAAILAGAIDQPLDLALSEIASLDCQVYDAWCAFLRCRFHAGKPCLRVSYCIGYMPFLHSQIESCLRFMVCSQSNRLGAGTYPRSAGSRAASNHRRGRDL